MDYPHAQITDTAYEPDTDLRDRLNAVADVEIDYQADREIDLPGELTAQQREYTMASTTAGDEFVLSGTETTGSHGVLLSLDGNLGFACAIALHHAVILGEPTQCYTDERVPDDVSSDIYQDITAEWYRPAAVEAELPPARLNQRGLDFETSGITLKEVEQYAMNWLSIDT
jgi:hypothetical protein